MGFLKTLTPRSPGDSFIAGVIFLITLIIFWLSPVTQLTDSNYSMLLSESLIHYRSFTLDQYAIPRLPPKWHDNNFKNGDIYQLELIGPHLYYYLPPGTSILSIPYVALINVAGISAATANGAYDPEGETRIEKGLAALLMASLTAIFFFTARLLLPQTWSALIAISGTLGTQVWSTASRALWSDTWAIFLLGIVLYMILAEVTGKRKINPVALATLLAWLYFVRPTNSISVAVIVIYFLLYDRSKLVPFVSTGALWLLGFVAYSWYHFHQLLPNYFMPNRLSFSSFGTAFAGNLVSPSRGLLVFVPTLLFIIYLLVTRFKTSLYKRFLAMAFPVILLHLIVIAGFSPWNGGFCYGPRYTTGLIPWFAVLSILAIHADLNYRRKESAKISKLFSHAPAVIGILLLGVSIFMNARGALSYETWIWNVWPTSVDKVPEKIWDWRQPQFLAGLVRPPLPATFPILEHRVNFGSQASERYVWYGWSWGEGNFRWSDGKAAAIIFEIAGRREGSLAISLAPFLPPGELDEQHVEILINDRLVESLVLKEAAARQYAFRISSNQFEERNILTFKLPDAVSPEALGISADQRRLGIRLEWLEFQPTEK